MDAETDWLGYGACSHLAQMLLLCRFAADGLWIAETSGVLHFDEVARSALLNRLLAFVDSL